jgi:hypothetical protein
MKRWRTFKFKVIVGYCPSTGYRLYSRFANGRTIWLRYRGRSFAIHIWWPYSGFNVGDEHEL